MLLRYRKPFGLEQSEQGACCKTLEQSGEAGHGRPMVEVFGLYHKDNAKLLKCFKQGGEMRFALFEVHPDSTEDNQLEESQMWGEPWQSGHI